MADQALWTNEAEVTAFIDLRDAIAALARGLTDEAAGGAVNMAKTHATFGRGDILHAIGATIVAWGIVGTKISDLSLVVEVLRMRKRQWRRSTARSEAPG